MLLEKFNNDSIKHCLTESDAIKLYGFCHNIRVNKKMVFVVLRKETETVQLIVFNDNPNYDKLKHLNSESTIYAEGKIVPAKVKTCTVTDYEIVCTDVDVINSAQKPVFSLDDADATFHSDYTNSNHNTDDSETEIELDETKIRRNVFRQTRLNNRWLDLRIPMNQNIFKLRSSLEASIRNVLIDDGFVEIHTPKIIPAVSEGGSNVFEVNFFSKKAFLAQSPQIYKQMVINGGFSKVFEIGSVFRAENTNTYRHLCEFTGLDIEFVISPNESHIDIIKNLWRILYRSYSIFVEKYGSQMDNVLTHTETERLVFPVEPCIINFVEGCELLEKAGVHQAVTEDIGSINEKKLGDIVKEKYGTDVYVLTDYPKHVRPFYTMSDSKDDGYSRSFDIMLRGNEISSGAQRITNPDTLRQELINRNIKIEGSGLEDYIKSFETGSLPHGGCGIGLERLVMLILGLNNVRTTSLFPRDPRRITP